MKNYLLIVLFQVVVIHAFPQSFLKVDGKKIVNESGDEVILKGMGLGGWMLQEGYMIKTSDFAPTQHEFREKIAELIGEEATETFYNAWLDNHVRKIDIDSLASWGFNCVRLPMHYNLFTLPVEKEPVPGENTWLNKGFDLTDQLLSWCADNEMYLILDLHAAPGGQGYDQAISDYDPSKPSLWESKPNRNKTVALWKKLAERYANEKWIGGYDLINETNWNLDNNALLKDLYVEITDSIRLVDQNHILFIEGNWFANDFTGLTPPWDSNMVYSFHKYWSYNNQEAIKWMLDIRDEYNIPIWLGESGENSNTWFRDCIKLMDAYGIGWAWWPMKKIDDIAGPLSISRTEQYQQLLDYWNGDAARPAVDFAINALMQLAENVKLENCRFQRDVIHAMFAQVESDESMPYAENRIPGIVYASDFDIGANRTAYFDLEVANYHVSSGNYTSWNNGWAYRNDGVDIEKSEDDVNSNGFNVGWIVAGEWMNYTVYAEKAGYYDILVRISAEGTPGGSFHFEMGGQPVSETINVEQTGSWQTWKSVQARGIYLDQGQNTLKFVCDAAGFNLGSFEFIFKYESVTGIEDPLEPSDILIYPNPGKDLIYVQSPGNKIKSYALLDINGKVIQYQILPASPTGMHVINTSILPAGLYFIRLEEKNAAKVFTVVIK